MGLEPDDTVFSPGSVALYTGAVDKVLHLVVAPWGEGSILCPKLAQMSD